MTRGLRWVLGGTIGFVLLCGAALLVLQALLERGALTAQIDTALQRATGRSVALGPISLRLSLSPHITARNSTIANIEGGSQAQFARVGRLEMNLALGPLLRGRVEIDHLTLADAEILLERDADGLPNWQFGHMGEAPGGGGIAIAAIRIENSRVTLPQGRLDITALDFRHLPDGSAFGVRGEVAFQGEAATLDIRLGRLVAPPPFRATITGAGFSLTAEGTLARRLQEEGWSLALRAEVASPARLMQLLGSDAALPALGPLSGTAKLGPGARLTDLTIRSGAATIEGLSLRQAVLTAATLDQPMTLAVEGNRGGRAASLNLALPALRVAFAAPANARLPVTARLAVGAARITASGSFTWANPLGAAPFDVTLTAPDLAALGPFLGLELPALRTVEARARLQRQGVAGLRLTAARASSTAFEVSGDIDITLAPRLSLTGRLAAARLDLDALLPAAPRASRPDGRLIPDIALPIESLRGFDATLDITASHMTALGLTWLAVRADALLTAGRLNLRSFAATTPGGPVTGRLTWDVAASPPAATLALQSGGRGLDVAAIRRELGTGIGAQGPVEVVLDLRGRGTTTRALAASLSGDLGVAMVEGRLSRAGMLRIGPDLTRVLLLGNAPPEGVQIRCLALRLTAEEGLAQSEALLLETSAGRIDGTLAINLRNEVLAARLRPDLRVFGANMRAPVGIGGTLAAPRVGVEPGQAVAQLMADTVANRLWRSSTVEWLRGGEGGPQRADCAAQLHAARLGRAGRAPEPPATVIPLIPRELQSPVQDVFRGIGGLLGGGRR